MSAKWVKALKPVTRYDLHGAYRTYQPGDWFECNNQEMRALLAERKIEVAQRVIRKELLSGDWAIVITGGDVKQAQDFISPYIAAIHNGLPHFPEDSKHVLWWDATAPLRLDLMPLGFHRVSSGWQTAIPLWRYNVLARDIGTDEARQRTKEVIHDLRVPVFDTRMIFVRRDDETEKLLELWMEERKSGDDDKLCFMRALYAVKPLTCALPVTWVTNAR
jgi:hypothetical protein